VLAPAVLEDRRRERREAIVRRVDDEAEGRRRQVDDQVRTEERARAEGGAGDPFLLHWSMHPDGRLLALTRSRPLPRPSLSLPPALDHLPPLLEMPANIHSLNDHKGKRPAAAATTASERASKKTRRRGSASSSDDDEDVDDGAAHGGAGGGDGSDDSSDEGMHVDDLDRIAALVGRGRAPGKRAVKPLPGAAAAAAAQQERARASRRAARCVVVVFSFRSTKHSGPGRALVIHRREEGLVSLERVHRLTAPSPRTRTCTLLSRGRYRESYLSHQEVD